MNLGDVKTRVKRQFGDESGVQITDDDIVRWTNDGIQFILDNNEGLLEAVNTADVITGQQQYDLPADLLTLKTVHLKQFPDSLSYVHLQAYDLQKFDEYVDGWDGTLYGPGPSYVYTVFAEKLQLFPIPTTDTPAGLKFYYNRKATLLDGTTDDIELDLPVGYHNAVVAYCLQQAYELDENPDLYARKGADVQNVINLNRYRQGKPNQETYATITAIYDDAW